MRITRDIIVTLNNGKIVGSDVSLRLIHDSNYGADSDGNRGIPTTFIEDVRYEIPKFTLDGDILSSEDMEESEILIERAIDNIDWNSYNE